MLLRRDCWGRLGAGVVEPHRILVLGSPGSGKSTLSRQLGEVLDLPVVHLDRLHWKPGWVESDPADFDQRLGAEIAKDCWIIDGGYSRTLDLRLPRATLILFLDFPRLRCVWNAFRRGWHYRGKTRPDMGVDCPERIDFEFLKFVWDYPERSRPRYLSVLAAHADRIPIVRLHSHAEVDRFLERVRTETLSGVVSFSE